MKRIRRTSAQWHELLKSFETSKLRATDFCHKHNIDPKYFSKKKIEYVSNPNNTNPFVKVQVNKPGMPTALLMSIEHSNCRLDFYQLPDIDYLSSLIKSVS